jgi:hypothetical protein
MVFEESMQRYRIELKWRAKVSEYVKLQKNLKRKNDSCSPEQYCKNEGINSSAFCWWLKYIRLEDKFTYHQSFAREYLGRAREALVLLEHYIELDPNLRMPLMRDAIISYAALFCKSNGRVFTKWNLEAQTFVPQHLQNVHKKICTYRDVIVAHCDIEPRDPKVSLFGISLKGQGFYWDDYKRLIPKFKELINLVLKRLESYAVQENLSSAKVAFKDLPDPPPAALKDPEK